MQKRGLGPPNDPFDLRFERVKQQSGTRPGDTDRGLELDRYPVEIPVDQPVNSVYPSQ